jgi:hypothetical protein
LGESFKYFVFTSSFLLHQTEGDSKVEWEEAGGEEKLEKKAIKCKYTFFD